MGYCVLDDLIKLLPETMLISLSNDEDNSVEVNQDNIDEAIDQADREIDAYCSVRYSVPFPATYPPLIVNLSSKMAIWNIHKRKYFGSEVWEKAYKDCIRLLELIARGLLDVTSAVSSNESIGVTRVQKFTSTEWSKYGG